MIFFYIFRVHATPPAPIANDSDANVKCEREKKNRIKLNMCINLA